MRRLVRIAVVLLVVRMLADIATPFSGAFRLDSTASVQIAEAAPRAVVVTAPPGPSGAPGRHSVARVAEPRRAPRSAPSVRTFFPRIVHLSESGSSPASDDD